MKTMKTKKTITTLLITVLMLIANSGWSAEQFKGDTVRIKFEEFMIEIISPDLIKNPLKQAGIQQNAIKISDWLEAVNINSLCQMS